jgi:HTH-type transcriptional regulator / antitoxin HigA
MPNGVDSTALAAYLELVRAFPLVSIRDDAHLNDSLAVIDRLVEQPQLTAAEEAYLGALTDLLKTYENIHVHIPPMSGVEALRYLMDENDLSQADLVPEFGTASIVSEVLAGKRRLSLTHIQRLAARFGLPAEVFMDVPVNRTTRRR